MGNAHAVKSGDLMVKVVDNITGLGDKLEKNAKDAFNTVSTDIQRTSSDASPKDTGFLEKNHLTTTFGGSAWVSTIYFRAFNNDFDYAHWTHDAHYNLGPGSSAKTGGSSRFAGSVPVGRHYLDRTVEQGRPQYENHLSKSITDTIG